MTQIEFSLIVFLTIFICLAALRLLKFSLLEPASLFLMGWLPGSILLISGGIMYFAPFGTFSTLFICSSIFMFTLGAVLHRVTMRPISMERDRQYAEQFPRELVSPALLGILYIGVVVFIVMSAPEVFRQLPGFVSGQANLGELRAEHWASFGEEAGSLGIAKAIGRTMAIILAIHLLFCVKRYRLWGGVILWAGLFLFVLDSLMLGGRFNLVLLALALFFGRIVARTSLLRSESGVIRVSTRIKTIRTWHLFALGGVGFFALVIFPFLRNPDALLYLERFLSWGFPSRFSDWVYALAEGNIMPWAPEFFYGTAYLSRAQVSAVHFFEITNIYEYYSLGAYNARVVLRVLAILDWDIMLEWYAVRDEIAELRSLDGLSTNPWATIVRDLSIDFGVGGTLVAMMALGFLFQSWFFWALRRNSALGITIATMICISSISCAFFSPLINQVITYPAILSAIFVWFGLDKFRFKKDSLARGFGANL